MRRAKFSLVRVNQISPLSSPTYLAAGQSRRRLVNATTSFTSIRSFNQAARFHASDCLPKSRSSQTDCSSTMTSEDFSVDDALVAKVTAYVEKYMSNYDASHDFNHIQRVLRLSLHIQSVTPEANRSLVTLAALLHDVGDKKYLQPGEDASRMISALLVSFGAPAALADTVQAICLGVSYSSEVKDPARTRALVEKYPELAVVQDADRLDAIGAVGIARTFAFGGAKGRTLENTMDHFDEKLLLLEGMMKTDEGRRMARERTERLRLMKEWWEEETTGPVGTQG